MSDSSEEENLSDLEETQAVNESGSDDEAQKPELKGILNDVEETVVSWKELVSFSFSAGSKHMVLISFATSRALLMCCAKPVRI